jgi:CSLREA domain-containing protein
MGIGLLVAAVVALAAPTAAMATVYTVNTTADHNDQACNAADCTLREALMAATSAADSVNLPSGNYVLTTGTELVLTADTIVGAGARTTFIDGGLKTRVLRAAGAGAAVTTSRVSGVTVRNGTGLSSAPSGTGGAILLAGGILELTNVTVSGSTASTGAGIAVTSGTLRMVGSTVAGNQAGNSTGGGIGGGISVGSGASSAELSNSTVSGNSALGGRGPSGGGIFAYGSLTLNNVTIAGNESVDGGGLNHSSISGQTSTDVIRNTIIAGNTGGACGGFQPTIDAFQGDHDLDDDGTCGFTAPSDRPNANPLLGALQNNGGPTDTRALGTGSPAIDTGDPATCLAADQRGTARLGTCDIGAFEYLPTPPQGGQNPQGLPPPVAGKTVNALTKSGTVKIKKPGSRAFVALGAGQQIPLGTIVDTLKGRVTIVAAADKKGGTATADFYGGIFKLGQTKGTNPITTLKLVEKLSCKASGKASAAAKKKKKRRLWGDGKGKFRTEGSYSSATVRGTKWLVQDTCTSTLTRVKRGRVAVRDFVKKKTVLVRAGKKYIARAKR